MSEPGYASNKAATSVTNKLKMAKQAKALELISDEWVTIDDITSRP